MAASGFHRSRSRAPGTLACIALGLSACRSASPPSTSPAPDIAAAWPAPASPDESRDWTASWIWCGGDPRPHNFYLYARKTVALTARPTHAPVRVSADSRYRLFVNGTPVARGPVRSDRRWQYFDEWDLAPWLRPGRNCVAALVHHYGEGTFQYMLGRGGFLLDGSVRCGDGSEVRLDTDDTWRVLPSSAWLRDIPRMDMQLGFNEIFDARREPAGWTQAEFDDAAWEPARLIGRPPGEPWPRMIARDIPAMLEREVVPARLLQTGSSGSPGEEPFIIALDRIMVPDQWGVAYCATWLHSPDDREVELGLGSDDALKLWVGGGTVVDHFEQRAAAPDQDRVTVKLKAGWTPVLAKVQQGTGGWTFIFRVIRGEGAGVVCSASKREDAPGWEVIGPFECPEGVPRVGYDAVYPPEQEGGGWNFDAAHPGKGGREVRWQAVTRSATSMSVASLIARESRDPIGDSTVQDAESVLARDGRAATVMTAPGRAVFLVLDFGREVAGYPRLHIASAHGGEIVDLGYAESTLDEKGIPLPPSGTRIGRVNPYRSDIHYADRIVCRPGAQTFETFDRRAFRYVHLAVRNAPEGVAIDGMTISFSTYPVRRQAAFDCDDARLNAIWGTGAYTVQLNMEDSYTDCPWRERGQWWGDALAEIGANYYAFGDLLLSRRGHLQMAQSQVWDGATWGLYPTDWDGGRLPDYSLIWILSLREYWLWSGDAALVRRLYPQVQRVLAFLDQTVDEHGLAAHVPYWVFIDWADVHKCGEGAALNAFYAGALAAAAEMAEGPAADGAGARVYRARAARVREAMLARLWDERRGVLRDCRACADEVERYWEKIKGEPAALARSKADHERVGDDYWSTHVSQQSNSLAVLFGILDGERAQRAIEVVHDERTPGLVKAGSPYFSYFVLGALYKLERHEQALAYIRKNWGAMLDWGATTWWELWNPMESLCHGWSAGPTHDLPAEFLGVKPTAPGWSEFLVHPHPADLKRASGRISTVAGPVGVAWERTIASGGGGGAGFRLTVDVPGGTRAEVRLPLGSAGASVAVNGGATPPTGIEVLGGAVYGGIPHARFRVTRAGSYLFETH